MNEGIIEKAIRCDCIGGEHYLHFIYFEKDDQLYIDLNAKQHKSFWRRIQQCWNVIRGKDSCYDGIILKRDKQLELEDFLHDMIDKDLVDVDLPSNGD